MAFVSSLSAAVLLAVISAGSSAVEFKPVDDLLSKQDKLTYRDCVLTRSVLPADKEHDLGQLVSVLKCKGKEIRSIRSDLTEFNKDTAALWNRFGLVPLLGGADDKQIIMMEYSGGAHCCWGYWVYALGPEPIEIYSTEKWGLGDPMGYADMDRDGVLEISQEVMTFDYFDRCSHATSSLPLVVFKYDKNRREYLPANEAFAGELLNNTDALIAALKRPATEKDDEGGAFLGAVLGIVLPYVYAGREKDGWRIFERIYGLPDQAEMEAKIKAALADDAVYRYLNRGLSNNPGKAAVRKKDTESRTK